MARKVDQIELKSRPSSRLLHSTGSGISRRRHFLWFLSAASCCLLIVLSEMSSSLRAAEMSAASATATAAMQSGPGRTGSASSSAIAGSLSGAGATSAAASSKVTARFGPPRTVPGQLTGSGQRAAAAAAAGQWQLRRQETEQLLGQLLELESRPSQSLDDCAYWFQLNMRHRELAGAYAVPRASAQQKEAECDQLEQLMAETREKVANFGQLLEAETGQLEFVGELIGEYLELSVAAAGDEELTRELNQMRSLPGSKVQAALAELDQFLQFVRNALAERDAELAANESAPPAATALVTSGSPNQPIDELSELDAALRYLIEREQELSEEQLGHLAEMGGALERRLLHEGALELSSGRFRALSGTLDAVRTILVHRMAEDEREKEAEVARQAKLRDAEEAEMQRRQLAEQLEQANRRLASASAAASATSGAAPLARVPLAPRGARATASATATAQSMSPDPSVYLSQYKQRVMAQKQQQQPKLMMQQVNQQ